jgi:hypothetical protein
MSADLLASALPPELHYYLLDFMSVQDLCVKLSTLSGYWRELAEDELLWKRLVTEYSSWGPKLKTDGITWKALYKKITALSFDAANCGKTITLSENELVATKSDDIKYATVLGSKLDENEEGGKHYWEIQIVNIQTSGCLCVGVVNTPEAINMHSESHGMFGHYAHGWGLFSDGERCHNGAWVRPAYQSFTSGDKIGILVEWTDEEKAQGEEDDEAKLKPKVTDGQVKGKKATVTFFINGVSQGVAFTGVSGPLYPAFALKRKGESIKLDPTASFEFLARSRPEQQ